MAGIDEPIASCTAPRAAVVVRAPAQQPRLIMNLYTMDIFIGSKINRLLSKGTYGGLFFSEWLDKMGYSAQLIKRYRESGWLESLTNGVMFRKSERLSALAAIHSFNKQTKKNVRIAAHSALELHGFSHYVPMGKPKLMVSFVP